MSPLLSRAEVCLQTCCEVKRERRNESGQAQRVQFAEDCWAFIFLLALQGCDVVAKCAKAASTKTVSQDADT